MLKGKYKKDVDSIAWLANYIAVVEGDEAELKVSAQQIDELKAAYDELAAKLDEKLAHRQAAKAAANEFRRLKKKISREISRQVRVLELSGDAPKDLLAKLGVETSGQANAGKVFAPEGLVAQGFSDGTNFLKWQRSGNDERNLFIIEARIGDAEDYIMVGATTKTKFYHRNQKPGVPIRYRVYASRSGRVSPHSDEAALYID